MYTPADLPSGLAADAVRPERPGHHAFRQVRNAELTYRRQLRKVAQAIHDLVAAYYTRNDIDAGATVLSDDIRGLANVLEQYSQVLRPWALRVARRMLAEVQQRDLSAWDRYTRKMSVALRREVREAPTGHIMQQLLDDQVDLITSLPRDAAQQLHSMVTQNMIQGTRARSLQPHIERELNESVRQGLLDATTNIKARASTIARTETSRSASSLTQARAQFVGSTHYIWRSSRDADVRPALSLPRRTFAMMNTAARGSHRLLEGKVIAWDDPPISGPKGERAHAGCIYNCRCYPEPIIPERY